MTFADPSTCPDCGSVLEGGSACQSCRLDLTSPAARQLWAALQSADAWLEEARRHRVPPARPAPAVPAARDAFPPPSDTADTPVVEAAGPPESASAAASAPSGPDTPMPAPTIDEGLDEPAPPHGPDAPTSQAPDSVGGTGIPRFPVGSGAPIHRPARRRVSVGTVLLALGALSLVVAAIIFLAVYWGPMGILGRAAVLFALTLMVGGFAVAVTRRGLRGSSEALWTVFLAFLSLDWLLSRSQGLFGLDTAPAAPVELAWAVVMVGLGIAIVRLGRRHLPRPGASGASPPATSDPEPVDASSGAAPGTTASPATPSVELVAPSVLAGLAVAFTLYRRLWDLADVGMRPFWALALVTIVSIGAAVLLRRLALRYGALVVALAAGLVASLAVVSAFGTAVTNPAFADLVARGEGLPLALVVLALLCAANAVRERAAIASVLAGAGTVSAVVLVTLPVGEQWLTTGVLVLHAALVLALVLATAGSGAVRRGVRWGAAVPLAVALTGLVVDATAVLAISAASIERAGSYGFAERIALELGYTVDAWRAVVVGLLVAAAVLRLAPALRAVDRAHTTTAAQLLTLAGVAATVALLEPTAVAMAAVIALGGLVIGVLGGRTVSVRLVLGATLAAFGPFAAVGSWWATAIVAMVVAVGLTVIAGRVPVERWRDAVGAVAAGWAQGALLAGLAAGEVAPRVVAYVLVAAVLALLLVAVLVLGRGSGRSGVEIAAGLGSLVALERVSVALGAGEQALVALAAAAVLVLLSRRTTDRWWYAIVGSVAALTAAALVSGGETAVLWDWAAGVWPAAAALLLLAALSTPTGWLRETIAGLGALLAGASAVPPVVLLGLPPVVEAAVLVAAAGAVVGVASTWAAGRSGALGAEVAAGVLALWGLALAVVELPLLEGVAIAYAATVVVVVLAWCIPRRSWYAVVGAALAWSGVAATLGVWSTAVWAWPTAGLLLAAAARPVVHRWRDGVAGSAAFVIAMSVLPGLRLLEADELLITSAVLVASAVAVGVAHRLLGTARGGFGVEVGGGSAAITAVSVAVAVLTPSAFAVVALMLGALATALAWLVPRRWWYALVGSGAATVSVISSVGETETALWSWPLAAVVVGVGAARLDGRRRDGLAGIAAVLLGACVHPVGDVASLNVAGATLALVAVASVLALLAVLVLRVPRGGPGVEVGAAILAATGLVAAAESTGPAHVALLLTIVGAVTALLSLLSRERDWYRWIGAVALAFAYVLRLVASEVGVVEAYTLPFGVVLLVAGALVTVRATDPPRRTLVTLGPGLLLTLAPSLPLALADPTSLRALLLGLAALTIMAAGIVARWQAPFVAGALVVTAVVLTNVGPYAWGLPRWVLIAAAGAAMLVTGVTWERRVQDGRAAVRWVGAMR